MTEHESQAMGGFVSAIALDGYGSDRALVTITSDTGGQHVIGVPWKLARLYYVGQYASIVVRLSDERPQGETHE